MTQFKRAAVKLHTKVIRDTILNGPEIRELIREKLEAIDQAAGGGHTIEVKKGKQRTRGAVIANTPETMVREAQTRSLSRGLDAGR